MSNNDRRPVPFMKGIFLFFYVILLSKSEDVIAQPYTQQQQRCSSRLENALEHMRRRSIPTKSARSYSGDTPYTLYQSFYGQNSEPEDDFYSAADRGFYAKRVQHYTAHQHNADASFAGGLEELFTTTTTTHNGYGHRQPHKLAAVSSVDVEDLKVRLPSKSTRTRWVEVDKCRFSTQNSTLETRLIFPDLTLSGKVVLQPTGGKCHMILRLRRAGIEFRTIPIGFESAGDEETRRVGAASVRTDSHFAEPGFISVFAHGCQGPSGVRLRHNSKRRFGFASDSDSERPTNNNPPPVTHMMAELSEPNVFSGATQDTSNSNYNNRWRKYYNPYAYDIRTNTYQNTNTNRPTNDHNWRILNAEMMENQFYNSRSMNENYLRAQFRGKRDVNPPPLSQENRLRPPPPTNDEFSFNDDILNVANDLEDLIAPDARTFAELYESQSDREQVDDDELERSNVRDRYEAGDAFDGELEKIFSMGVRGLLTTYMQRALQPAIKETLMENMGYTLSYG